MPVTEQFEYIKHPVAPFPLSEPEYTSAPREKIREDQKKHPFSLKALFSFLSEDEEEGDSLYAVLPDFIDDDLEPTGPLPIMGILFAVFIVSKSGYHRSEDRFISISGIWSFIKGNPEQSYYGKTQGNATLEAAPTVFLLLRTLFIRMGKAVSYMAGISGSHRCPPQGGERLTFSIH